MKAKQPFDFDAYLAEVESKRLTHVIGFGRWYARVTTRRGWDKAMTCMDLGPKASATSDFARSRGLA